MFEVLQSKHTPGGILDDLDNLGEAPPLSIIYISQATVERVATTMGELQVLGVDASQLQLWLR